MKIEKLYAHILFSKTPCISSMDVVIVKLRELVPDTIRRAIKFSFSEN